MELTSLKHLIEILKSQMVHYTEMRDMLASEKDAVNNFNSKELIELNKRKEQLSKKEALLEEARNTILLRLKNELSLEEATILNIIDAVNDCPEKELLIELRDSLLYLVSEISQITVSLKILYSTNLRIISEIKSKMGFIPDNKYGMEKSTVSLPTSLRITG